MTTNNKNVYSKHRSRGVGINTGLERSDWLKYLEQPIRGLKMSMV